LVPVVGVEHTRYRYHGILSFSPYNDVYWFIVFCGYFVGVLRQNPIIYCALIGLVVFIKVHRFAFLREKYEKNNC